MLCYEEFNIIIRIILCNKWEPLWAWVSLKSSQVSTTVWCHLVVFVRFNLNINRDFWFYGFLEIAQQCQWFHWIFLLIGHISKQKQKRTASNAGALGPISVSYIFLSLGCLLFTHLYWPSPPTIPLFLSIEVKRYFNFSRLGTGCGLSNLVMSKTLL